MIHKHQHFDLLGKVILERMIFTPPLRVFDKMEDEACLLYALEGTSTLYGVNEKYALENDQGVLMKCGNYFNHWHSNTTGKQNEAVAVHLYPEVIKYIYADDVPTFLTAHKRTSPTFFQSLQNQDLIKNYVNGLLIYFETPALVDENLIVLKLKELLLLLYKLNSNGIRDILHDLFNPHEVDFKQAIKASLYEDLSIEELAQLTNYSLSSFKRKFKEVFNEAPATYIKARRLEKAARLLQVSTNRIIDICFDCGFNNVDSFSRAFKKSYGYSPSEFRQR